MKLRHRLRDSRFLTSIVTRVFEGWIRFCHRTTRWKIHGTAEVADALSDGPVILILWHEHLMMAPMHWERHGGPLMSIHDTSPIGKLAGALQPRFGLTPMAMSSRTTNLAMSRAVKRNVADGLSIGITADGPDGPPGALKSAPLEWARSTGLPVFVYAFAKTRARRLDSWDRMILPMPFGRGAYGYARWQGEVPRKATEEQVEAIRRDIELLLKDTVDATISACGGSVE